MPKVSVIVPFFEVVEKHFRDCLDSLCSQTMQDTEFLLVSDGASSKNTSICDEYIKNDHRFRLLTKEHSGVSATRNLGIKQALGEYIVFVDADDTLYNNRSLERCYESVQKNNSDIILFDWITKGKDPLSLWPEDITTLSDTEKETWESKIWNSENNKNKKILIEQTYPGEEDTINHFYSLIEAFKDERYIKINNCPVFIIYRPLNHPDIQHFMTKWNELINKEKIASSFYFIANTTDFEYSKMESLRFTAAIISPGERMYEAYKDKNIFYRALHYFFRLTIKLPLLISYKSFIKYLWKPTIDSKDFVIPTLLPNWDHSPRSKNYFPILFNSTPSLFKKHCSQVLTEIERKKNKLVILKSWNEWAEGNYMEPDLKYGKGFIKALAETKKSCKTYD